MDIIVWIEYENNYISFIWLIFGYNRLSKPLILAWIIFGFKFWNIFMTIVISISATHFLILRIKPSLDFADQFQAYTCCFFKIPKKFSIGRIWGLFGGLWSRGTKYVSFWVKKSWVFCASISHKNSKNVKKIFFFKYECSGHIFWSILTF